MTLEISMSGSHSIAQHVAKAPGVTSNLTPVTYELGGKSPVILDRSALYPKSLFGFGPERRDDASFRQLVTRLMRSKVWNSGQICIAVDYVLVHEAIHDDFIKVLEHAEALDIPERHEFCCFSRCK